MTATFKICPKSKDSLVHFVDAITQLKVNADLVVPCGATYYKTQIPAVDIIRAMDKIRAMRYKNRSVWFMSIFKLGDVPPYI